MTDPAVGEAADVARRQFKPKPVTISPGAAEAAAARSAAAASRVASINLSALTGRGDIQQGSRVQIMSGLYSGEFAIVESVVGGVIPAALVRTEAGAGRRVRTVDLVPAPLDKAPAAPKAESPVEPAGSDAEPDR